MAKKKRIFTKILLWTLIILLVTALALMPLIAKEEQKTDGPVASILSGKVEKATITKQIIGGGTLLAESATTLTVPAEIKLTEFLVKNGDLISEGDQIAKVDKVSVMSAIASVQETLLLLSEDIENEKSKATDGNLKALAGGTVKHLYAKEGDTVQDVMLKNGALAVLSLDNLMAVEISTESSLSSGATVSVVFADNTSVSGTVVSNLLGKIIVTLEDNNYSVETPVTVKSTDGTALGEGNLYIYSPWKLTSYSGTITDIKVSEGETLKAGQTILTLSDNNLSATYQKLLNERADYEKLMLDLFEMYQTETVKASASGVITGIDKNSTMLLSPTKSSRKLLSNAPDGIDGYTNYVGKVSLITDNGWALSVSKDKLDVEDYQDIKNLPETLTELVIFYPENVPLYENKDGAWAQLQYSEVSVSDTLLFACDDTGNLIWIVRVSKEVSTPEATLPPVNTQEPQTSMPPANTQMPQTSMPPASTQEPQTSMPPANTQMPQTSMPPINTQMPQVSNAPQASSPATSANPNFSGNGSFPSGSGNATMPNFSGNSGSISGGATYPNGNFGNSGEAEIQFYSLDVSQIASIIPDDTVSVEISVNELDMVNLTIGMEATVQLDALGGEKFSATVSNISNSGENNGGYSYYTVTLSLSKAENMLAGMNAMVTITTSTTENVISVPNEALVEKGTKTVIYTSYDEETNTLSGEKEVVSGASDGLNVEIISGLSEGDTYYYEYYDTLTLSVTPDASSSGFGGMGGFGGGRNNKGER